MKIASRHTETGSLTFEHGPPGHRRRQGRGPRFNCCLFVQSKINFQWNAEGKREAKYAVHVLPTCPFDSLFMLNSISLDVGGRAMASSDSTELQQLSRLFNAIKKCDADFIHKTRVLRHLPQVKWKVL